MHSILTCHRLILYFPVSALVTLFGNILQNPNDPRARSDVRLMNLVVSFLSMLATDEENGGVKRMLGVCSEFERIAKVVLDKAEKDSSSKRKRKNAEDQAKDRSAYPSSGIHPQKMHQQAMATVYSPNMGAQPPVNGFSSPPPVNGHMNGHAMNGSPGLGSPGSQQIWQAPDYAANANEYLNPTQNGMTPFADIPGYTNGNEVNSPLNINNFQQPFVPQDLWQMPMTLEWDWAEMTGMLFFLQSVMCILIRFAGGQYGSFENGSMGDPNLGMQNNSNLQHRQM